MLRFGGAQEGVSCFVRPEEVRSKYSRAFEGNESQVLVRWACGAGLRSTSCRDSELCKLGLVEGLEIVEKI